MYGPPETLDRLRGVLQLHLRRSVAAFEGTSKPEPRAARRSSRAARSTSRGRTSCRWPSVTGTFGCTATGSGLAYITDVEGRARGRARRLRGLDVLVLNALWWRPHPTHLSIGEAIETRAGARRPAHLAHPSDARDRSRRARRPRCPPGSSRRTTDSPWRCRDPHWPTDGCCRTVSTGCTGCRVRGSTSWPRRFGAVQAEVRRRRAARRVRVLRAGRPGRDRCARSRLRRGRGAGARSRARARHRRVGAGREGAADRAAAARPGTSWTTRAASSSRASPCWTTWTRPPCARRCAGSIRAECW